MKGKLKSKDPDILGSLPAMRRAAVAARKLAETTGTPVYILRDGVVTNLNPRGKKKINRRAPLG